MKIWNKGKVPALAKMEHFGHLQRTSMSLTYQNTNMLQVPGPTRFCALCAKAFQDGKGLRRFRPYRLKGLVLADIIFKLRH